MRYGITLSSNDLPSLSATVSNLFGGLGLLRIFPGKVLGRFLQNLAVFMKWCDAISVDNLWRSLTIQWWGVGTR
ncbi:hypothetical protein D3C76_626260 [compost metagenome]|jgi:hypothetical protein